MPVIRPISDLRNSSNEISEFCRSAREPVFITKNGVGDMVVMSIEMYERQQAQLELYVELSKAEAARLSLSFMLSCQKPKRRKIPVIRVKTFSMSRNQREKS